MRMIPIEIPISITTVN